MLVFFSLLPIKQRDSSKNWLQSWEGDKSRIIDTCMRGRMVRLKISSQVKTNQKKSPKTTQCVCSEHSLVRALMELDKAFQIVSSGAHLMCQSNGKPNQLYSSKCQGSKPFPWQRSEREIVCTLLNSLALQHATVTKAVDWTGPL